ncbi:unnamed protein product [Cuscuta campestris]|uniref:Uncharacterized protein n=1 Tax=Cuscuta campestris TaxID=132261 RepID=A0A484KLP1_9ASTE|nr:unnamed protein product [Cuscuta campestris]
MSGGFCELLWRRFMFPAVSSLLLPCFPSFGVLLPPRWMLLPLPPMIATTYRCSYCATTGSGSEGRRGASIV